MSASSWKRKNPEFFLFANTSTSRVSPLNTNERNEWQIQEALPPHDRAPLSRSKLLLLSSRMPTSCTSNPMWLSGSRRRASNCVSSGPSALWTRKRHRCPLPTEERPAVQKARCNKTIAHFWELKSIDRWYFSCSVFSGRTSERWHSRGLYAESRQPRVRRDNEQNATSCNSSTRYSNSCTTFVSCLPGSTSIERTLSFQWSARNISCAAAPPASPGSNMVFIIGAWVPVLQYNWDSWRVEMIRRAVRTCNLEKSVSRRLVILK